MTLDDILQEGLVFEQGLAKKYILQASIATALKPQLMSEQHLDMEIRTF